jgi:erythromycin esterase-like protein
MTPAPVTEVRALIAASPELLAFGEPTHGEPAFPQLRNALLQALVEDGFRSIAIESDRVAALDVDAYVRGGDGTLDAVTATGFSHGLGQLDANRDLVAWLHGHNAGRPPGDRVAFHGFDAPLEMTAAPSPGPYLRHLHDYLTAHLGTDGFRHGRADLGALLGDDGRWSDFAALMDATKSVGGEAAAATLRAVADDLVTTLYAEAPRLVAASSRRAWHRAEVHGTTALGLLRYHAVAADPIAPQERTSRLLGIRDALMARNLLDIRAAERHRGPTLVFAHNRHLQRHPSTWHLAGMDLTWSSAGAVVATLLGGRYVYIAGSLGSSAALGLAAPDVGTFEHALGPGLVDAAALAAITGGLRERTDVTAEQGYFPLDAATLADCDALLHVPAAAPDGPDPAALAERILALPGTELLLATEESGAPETSWGDRFFYVGPDRRLPFATIVGRDTPGWDEASRLDRPGVFRVNVHAGREEFQRLLGYPPAELEQRRAGVDFARLDAILPHPSYGRQGWVCVLNPGPRTVADLDGLIVTAHHRAALRRSG